MVLAVCSVLRGVCCLSFVAARCPLPVGCCLLLFVMRCLLCVVRCALSVDNCGALVFVVCWLVLLVVYCALFGVRDYSVVVWCVGMCRSLFGVWCV